ncbi:MAG: glycosyltransferase family A protein [Cyanobacteria bacterium P01_D01_bin.1]
MTAQHPLVSVIIPTHDRQNLIEPAIRSVLHQTYENYELWIVDDASGDGTADWIAQHYPQVQLIRLSENVGAAEARNVGIRAAKGTLIAFLDSDDHWAPNYLETQVRSLLDNPDASFVFCNHRETLSNGTIKQYVYRPRQQYQDLVHRSLADVFIYTMSVVVVRKSALDECGLLDKRLIICHDRELYVRLLQVGEMAHVRDFLVTRVMHEQNISTDYQRWAKYVFLMLDIFFSNSHNQTYKHLEPTIRSAWAMIIARHIWRTEKSLWSSSVMVLRAVSAAPKLMFSKLQKKVIWQFS